MYPFLLLCLLIFYKTLKSSKIVNIDHILHRQADLENSKGLKDSGVNFDGVREVIVPAYCCGTLGFWTVSKTQKKHFQANCLTVLAESRALFPNSLQEGLC